MTKYQRTLLMMGTCRHAGVASHRKLGIGARTLFLGMSVPTLKIKQQHPRPNYHPIRVLDATHC